MSVQLPDITRNYHGGAANSESANAFVQPKKTKLCDQVAAFIDSCGKRGATLHEVCKSLGLKIQTGSARMSELKKDHRIYWNGLKRATDGSQPANCFVSSKGQLGFWEQGR